MAVKITVIGAGPGGYPAAIHAARNGAEVTIIEKEKPGGVCLNWGCIPSKIMLSAAGLLRQFNRSEEFGVRFDGSFQIDMKALMARKQTVIQTQAEGIKSLLKRYGVNYLKGAARIKKNGVTSVRSADGHETDVNWDRLIIASGTRPASIPAASFDGEYVMSSNDALGVETVPESTVIVGGGVIGCEFACILSGLGSAVTIIEALPRLLPVPSIDDNCSKLLQREFKKRKIGFMTGKIVESCKRNANGLEITIGPSPFMEHPSEKEKRRAVIHAEKILVCVGRRPNSDRLGLENAGVQTDARGWIKVDETLQTANQNIYAAGDILGPAHIMLAHAATAEGELAAENAMGASTPMDYSAVPSAIFTHPEIANIGITESQAREQHLNVRTDTVLFRNIGKAQASGEIAGEAKIVSDAGSGVVLGVHIIGPHASELIAEGTLAVRKKLTVSDLAHTIHAHPTLSEILAETALKAIGRPLHG